MLGQYSTRTMMGLVAAFSVSLALTRVNFLYGAGVMVAYVVAVAFFGKNLLRKRALIYGAVGGACLFLVLSAMVATLRGEAPRGRGRGSGESATVRLTRQCAIPIGGFIGGLTGCMYASARTTRAERANDSS